MKLIVTTLFLALTAASFAQDKKEQARELAREGIRLEDQEGRYEEALALFEKAAKLDPDNFDYPYEMVYAYVSMKDYKKAIKLAKTLTKHPDCYDQLYQLLGNSYDLNGDPVKAIATYNEGLERFPNSGKLYLERGNVYLVQEKYNEAISSYEMGIMVEPDFPSNYYRAAKLYLNSTDELWGMLYGEIFINLEPTTKRTEDMSRLLYKTYKSEIVFESKGDSTSVKVGFSGKVTINMTLEDLENPEAFKLPFPIGCYEMNMSVAAAMEKQIDLASLNRMRALFVGIYFDNGQDKTYPNVLFDYQKAIKDAGHMEAYNYWLLMQGDPKAFEEWFNTNEEKFNAFAAWFGENRLQMTEDHRFFRKQYD